MKQIRDTIINSMLLFDLTVCAIAFTLTLLIAEIVFGADTVYTLNVPKETITKVDAIKKLLLDPRTPIYKCQQVEITDKVTLRNK